ncbi:hypothetical protein EP7_003807 [Isosphaeraceae bacterium EP7]
MVSFLVAFALYWFMFFVASFFVIELAQRQFYDEVTPSAGLKVTAGSFIMAALAMWARPSYETMYTAELHWTALQAIVWFLIFVFIYQFHPLHALIVSLATLLLIPGAATIAAESLTRARPVDRRTQYREDPKPMRKSALPDLSRPAPKAAPAPVKK